MRSTSGLATQCVQDEVTIFHPVLGPAAAEGRWRLPQRPAFSLPLAGLGLIRWAIPVSGQDSHCHYHFTTFASDCNWGMYDTPPLSKR